MVIALTCQDDRHERDLALAYSIAGFTRRKTLPPFRELLARGRRRRQTPAQQRGVMAHLSAELGIPLRRVRLVHVDPRKPDPNG